MSTGNETRQSGCVKCIMAMSSSHHRHHIGILSACNVTIPGISVGIQKCHLAPVEVPLQCHVTSPIVSLVTYSLLLRMLQLFTLMLLTQVSLTQASLTQVSLTQVSLTNVSLTNMSLTQVTNLTQVVVVIVVLVVVQ